MFLRSGKCTPAHWLWLVALAAIHCSATTAIEDINATSTLVRVNGGQVVGQLVPFQVSLQAMRRGRWHHFCGGSIISAQHVLTAAHCVNHTRVQDISVVAGTLTWRSGGWRYNVRNKRVHPLFQLTPRIINDIAVLQVTPQFDLRAGSSLSAVSLGSRARIGASWPVRLTGWGLTTATYVPPANGGGGGGGLPEQLQSLHYHTITNQECAQRGFSVTANEVCALATVGQGACMGDSGGPLAYLRSTQPDQLIGIVSYGTARCGQGRPDVYTRISSFLPYINRVITSELT